MSKPRPHVFDSTGSSHSANFECSSSSGHSSGKAAIAVENVAGSIAATYTAAKDAVGSLYRSVSSPIKEFDLTALMESKLSFPSSFHGAGDGQLLEVEIDRIECVTPHGSRRRAGSIELPNTILVNAALEDSERVVDSMGSLSAGFTSRGTKNRSLSGSSTIITTASLIDQGEGRTQLTLGAGGSRLLQRRTKRFHTVAEGVSSKTRTAAATVRAEPRELLKL
ncbi:hypothetical protein FOL47_008774 [Perkinsus chesapeaki]|uniref:Uncharacterized protein n=1 Tax=Perkinsus chesapeaki TaxID=330153 RepID=A0A7J6MT74_PERCH|nr:hypothetical protein FOL47_008774 [Perkinsus chesapeaki]